MKNVETRTLGKVFSFHDDTTESVALPFFSFYNPNLCYFHPMFLGELAVNVAYYWVKM